LLLTVACALRLGAAVAVQQQLPAGEICLIPGDADGYWELGQKLARGEPYEVYQPPRRVLRMPGFPLVLAFGIKLFGPHLLAVRFLLAGIGALACYLVYRLGRELFDAPTGLLAAALAAVSPTFVGFSVLILSETLFAVGVLASMIALAKLTRIDFSPESRRRGLTQAACAGFWIAAACYVRPSLLLFAPYFGLIYCLFASDRRAALGRSLLLLGVLALTLSPWAVRNYRVTQHFVPTTLWFGPSLYDGLNPHATGDSDMTFVESDALYQKMSEYDVDREYRRRAWDFAWSHPGRVATLAVVKFGRYWSPWPNAAQFQGWLARLAVAGFFLPMVGLALVALAEQFRGGWGVLRQKLWTRDLTVGPILYFAALHMVFVGSIRYRLPTEYSMLVMSAAGARLIWSWYRPDRVVGPESSS
jgi:4-amino-4-deoxy-L-arabinose transferase-like glycosyltransferase